MLLARQSHVNGHKLFSAACASGADHMLQVATWKRAATLWERNAHISLRMPSHKDLHHVTRKDTP